MRTLLAKFGLRADHVLRPAGSLSPGERTRAALALLQARGVNLLVLDEPTNHLDLPAIEQLEQALDSFPGTLLLVTPRPAAARCRPRHPPAARGRRNGHGGGRVSSPDQIPGQPRGDLLEEGRAALRALVGPRTPTSGRGSGRRCPPWSSTGPRGRALVVQRTGWGKSAVYFVATALLRAPRARARR